MATKPAKKQASTPTKKATTATRKKVVKAAAPANKTPAIRPVTAIEQRFVDEYMVDLNATQAAIRAGYSAKTASQQAYQILQKPSVQAAIQLARQQQQSRTQITADMALREAWNQMTADARELSSVTYYCCRHCHGVDHGYQWIDEPEFSRSVIAAIQNNKVLKDEGLPEAKLPTDAGGYGFDAHRDANEACPKCHGEGVMSIRIGDSRKLSPQAAAIYAGVKQTRHGIEILMHSKDAAMEKIFKHLGLYERDNSQKVDPLASLLHRIAQSNSSAFTPVADDPERKKDGG